MRKINPDLIRREPTASLLNVSVRHLDRLTAAGKIPQPFKFGPNCVLYSKSEILAYLEAQADNKVSA